MIKSMTAAWWVQRWAELQPEKAAIIYSGRAISYRTLHQRADKTACWLQSIGIEKGDRVAIMLFNCPEFIDLFLACSRLGAIFVPINYRAASQELDYFLKNCRPRLFIFSQCFIDTTVTLSLDQYLPPMMTAVVGDGNTVAGKFNFTAEVDEFEGCHPFLTQSLSPSDPEEPHVIMYTSGTTGRPKGAVLSHRKTFFNCLNAEIFFKLNGEDVMLVFLPLFHSGGLFIQAAPILYKGATLVLHSRFKPEHVYADIQRYQVTKFLGVPTVFKTLLTVPPDKRADISSLRVCAGGGEKLTDGLIRQCRDAGFAFRQIMGQTETSILLWASEEDPVKKPGTVGKPVFHADITIVDPQGKTVPPGDVGEIVVRGSIMMKEYWQDPVRTGETIKNGYLHTGDLARMDEDGYFYLAGRSHDMYISGGENVYPVEVETVLREHPAVDDVAVVGMPDPRWGEAGHAVVMLKPGAWASEQEIIATCNDRLAKFKWPKKVTFTPSFPRTSLGKIIKTDLLDHLRADQEID